MQPIEPDRIDPIAILREELIAAGIAHGADRCEELAENVVQRYVRRLGGMPVYVRSQRARDSAKVADEIYQKFNGVNTKALAREYGKSARTVQRIILARRAAANSQR
ncbi:Mor transcription activator family protein [Paracidovorax wautersii]|uniref:Mor transcription activator family protein n=1 Tax=Paracidovorax wautersii TaxID=1177982 RepID=A0A1I2E7D3_9BURK|nr:Mor transcription activator family protein [Paracidovorax wautersii]SFE88613.1 Mor transcription activator family protein [Paracidovorax wautersii]